MNKHKGFLRGTAGVAIDCINRQRQSAVARPPIKPIISV
jgi:hypothetical protein